ncbi:peptidase dimerization domain-containing protein [Pseudomonas sp. LP_7_YM]|uniref:peptidase dimerization domain-containing protein n=1 Tax=Pseudomonas sp. LP_7_YM TaxID=2485137 RepID=UPI001414D570
MPALARPDENLLINPGVIEGGTKPNVVCDKASVTIDVRFQQLKDWDHTVTVLDENSGHVDIYNQKLKQGTHSEWVKLAEMPVLPATGSRELVNLGSEVAKSLGQTFKARAVGYGSDGNNIASPNIQILVGLGPYGDGMHSEKEFMQLSSYQERLIFATALIRKLNPATRTTP